MKTKLALVTLALAFSGCASYRVPPITAQELTYDRKDPAGGTVITAKNVRVEDGKVKADEVNWVTTYPAFSIRVQAKGYERVVKKE